MLLTITTTHEPATDLGYLLHKHPDKVQRFELPFGSAHVFYPEATEQRCTAALALTVDPVSLVRRRDAVALADYVDERPYVASSLLTVALNSVYRTAMQGTCNGKQELADAAIPLEAHLPSTAARGGEALTKRLFEPLGYDVTATPLELDPEHAEWGHAPAVDLTLKQTIRLSELLTHLYVLLPVLAADKHYWIDDDETEKLERRGIGWLAGHPERELIVRRYLKQQRHLYKPALAKLEAEDPPPPDDEETPEQELEEQVSLRDQRHGTVLALIKASGAASVLDLGCGPGALLKGLMKDGYKRIVGVDVSTRALDKAARRLRLDDLHDAQRERISLMQSALTYRDKRLEGFDAAILMEVIEHFDPPRLAATAQNVFGTARPRTVVVTTPNREYNVRWESLPAGKFRHPDHRFEWTRAEFAEWANTTADRYGYTVRFVPIGPEDEHVGPPTQAGVFRVRDALGGSPADGPEAGARRGPLESHRAD